MDLGHVRQREERPVYGITRLFVLVSSRCLFPCLRRVPRFTKRRAAQLLAVIWLCWVVVACTEWRAQHNQHNVRKQLIEFLQETHLYVVEEGHIWEGFQSPMQRVPTDLGRSSPSNVGERKSFAYQEVVEVESGVRKKRSADHHLFVKAVGGPIDGVKRLRQQEIRERESFALVDGEGGSRLEPPENNGNVRTAKAKADSKYNIKAASHLEGHNAGDLDEAHQKIVCPLIYTADANTAKEHGLHLFQEELDLLATVTARFCRCLCLLPADGDDPDRPQGIHSRRVDSSDSTDNRQGSGADYLEPSPLVWQPGTSALHMQRGGTDRHIMGQLGTDSRETQRKLSVCKGEEHTLMLNEILKGANVVIAGDSGWFYRWFASMRDAYRRTCSHFSTRATMGVPEGTVLRTLLTGTDMFEDSWFQLEGAPWRPLRHPLDAIRHGFNYVQYKLTRSQVGPLGKSPHTDLQPMMINFDGCISAEAEEDPPQQRREGLLVIPDI